MYISEQFQTKSASSALSITFFYQTVLEIAFLLSPVLYEKMSYRCNLQCIQLFNKLDNKAFTTKFEPINKQI